MAAPSGGAPPAERPIYRLGDRSIRNDGVHELVRIDENRYVIASDRRWVSLIAVVASVLAAHGCALAPPRGPDDGLTGLASWYGPRHQGRPTASGEAFDVHALTAAHRTLPLGARVRVTNVENGRTVVVRITDRGPYADERVIDLSYAAGKALGLIERGVARVRLQVLSVSE